MRKLLLTTALSGLMLSSAMAQYSSPSGSGSSSQAPAASSDSLKSDASKSSTMGAGSSSASASGATVASQKPDQLLASNLKGADVLGADDKKIGDVSDILFAKDGKIEAYILSVGGFLGVGAKEVALAPSSIQLTQDKDTWKLKVSMTKDQLAQAPNFEHYKAQRTTTGTSSSGMGSATAPRNAPSGSGMGPGGNPPANRP